MGVSPRYGATNVLIYVIICSLAGSLGVMGIKTVAVALTLLAQGKSIFTEPILYVSVLTTASCVTLQLHFLNKALDRYNTALVTNVYYVCFTTLTIIATEILYQDFRITDTYSGMNVASALTGFMTICVGVLALYRSNQEQ